MIAGQLLSINQWNAAFYVFDHPPPPCFSSVSMSFRARGQSFSMMSARLRVVSVKIHT